MRRDLPERLQDGWRVALAGQPCAFQPVQRGEVALVRQCDQLARLKFKEGRPADASLPRHVAAAVDRAPGEIGVDGGGGDDVLAEERQGQIAEVVPE